MSTAIVTATVTTELMPLVDAAHLRQFAGRFATGVAIIASRDGQGEFKGLVVNSVTALSLDPPLYLVCLDTKSNTLQAIAESGVFSINFLNERQIDICRHFASKAPDKFASMEVVCGPGGAPLIQGSLASCECKVVNFYPGGDHEIVVGAVDQVMIGEGSPLLFYRGAYGAWPEGDKR
ncbi:MAG: flavin reductase [Alphaproteobacteria bacterium]|jgi:flavin reductase (DIM6/NTAB) family NADH-FMN oxidoreductase RutF|nr:flavin reductase [Alphaproteobacteria bacterium]